MPRGEGNWGAFFKRNDAKNIARRKRQGDNVKERKTPVTRASWSSLMLPRLVGEVFEQPVASKISNITRFAADNRRRPTKAERELDRILWDLNGGAMRGRYKKQHAISGRWIVDFYFPEVRLAVEVDGGYHGLPEQRVRDREKERDCKRFDITLIRVTNAEVLGFRQDLVQKLRAGWRAAKKRPNLIIGKQTPLPRQ